MQDGQTVLSIPNSADIVTTDTDNQVIYQVNNAVDVNNGSDQALSAPVTVDSQITSQDSDQATGVTTITTNLADTQPVAEDFDNNSLLSIGDNLFNGLFTTKAYATQTYSTKTSGYDTTVSAKLTLTVYWSESGVGRKVTSVKGNYSLVDPDVVLNTSSVTIGSSGIQHPNQIKSWTLGTKNYWTITTGYDYVNANDISSGGASYYATLLRGSTKWSFHISDTD